MSAYQRGKNAVEQTAEVGDESLVTWRTLADIEAKPLQDLLLGMLEPDGPNLMYGPGGVGKGSTVAWMVTELVKIGMRPLIYDAENRPQEWVRRTSGLGLDRSRVIYVQPKDLPRAVMGQPLWEVVLHLGKIAKAAGADIAFVDSILAAMNIDADRLKSDGQAPYLSVAALDTLGIPSVAVGHTPKGSSDGDPYGSVSWVNAMRLTWLGTAGEGDGHSVRWRPRKRNERGHIAGVLLHFQYTENVLSGVRREDDEESTKHWIRLALSGGARTVEDMADELVETLEDPTPAALERAKARLRQTLGRMKHNGLANKVDRKRNSPWKLTGTVTHGYP